MKRVEVEWRDSDGDLNCLTGDLVYENAYVLLVSEDPAVMVQVCKYEPADNVLVAVRNAADAEGLA